MIYSEHYIYDPKYFIKFRGDNNKIITLPIIKATQSHLEAIQESFIQLHCRMSHSDMMRKIEEMHKNPQLRNPQIHQVELYQDYDVIVTGGFYGRNYLTASHYSDFPDKLEDFTNKDLEGFLGKFSYMPSELNELWNIEKQLKDSNPDYRKIL